MTDDAAPTRRTHAERRAETIDLLVNATIDAIAEVGLRNATTGEICRRAGVSAGALFHHFDTHLDLVVKAVEHLLPQRLRRFYDFMESVGGNDDEGPDPHAIVSLLRTISREPRSTVWIEALVASRTDPELRRRLLPTLERQRALFATAAELHPRVRRIPEPVKAAWLEILRNVLQIEAIWEPTVRHHELDEPKLSALLALARDLGPAASPMYGS